MAMPIAIWPMQKLLFSGPKPSTFTINFLSLTKYHFESHTPHCPIPIFDAIRELNIDKLGGNVNVVDAESGEPGEIFLDSNGFRITFGSKSHLIPLDQVKLCRISGEDTFSFEVADHFLDGATWSFKTDVAAVLLNQWERLIGVAEAKNLMNTFSGAITPMSSHSRTSSASNMNTILER
ncbi:hypothetical protein ACTXT7_016074 [Hymenolepis weldensis]